MKKNKKATSKTCSHDSLFVPSSSLFCFFCFFFSLFSFLLYTFPNGEANANNRPHSENARRTSSRNACTSPLAASARCTAVHHRLSSLPFSVSHRCRTKLSTNASCVTKRRRTCSLTSSHRTSPPPSLVGVGVENKKEEAPFPFSPKRGTSFPPLSHRVMGEREMAVVIVGVDMVVLFHTASCVPDLPPPPSSLDPMSSAPVERHPPVLMRCVVVVIAPPSLPPVQPEEESPAEVLPSRRLRLDSAARREGSLDV